jgi:hypothetical protein
VLIASMSCSIKCVVCVCLLTPARHGACCLCCNPLPVRCACGDLAQASSLGLWQAGCHSMAQHNAHHQVPCQHSKLSQHPGCTVHGPIPTTATSPDCLCHILRRGRLQAFLAAVCRLQHRVTNACIPGVVHTFSQLFSHPEGVCAAPRRVWCPQALPQPAQPPSCSRCPAAPGRALCQSDLRGVEQHTTGRHAAAECCCEGCSED